ncbi:hypothetical protein ABIC27_005450 [Streptomyces sp. PvR034]
MELWQRTPTVARRHVGDQVPDGWSPYVLGCAGCRDPQGLVAVGEAALLCVGTGGFHP